MSLCAHFKPGDLPFEFVLVLDEHLGPTDALIRCRSCRRPFLIGMIDWLEAQRLFRLSEPDPEAAALLLRDLDRGSCDLGRATEEIRQFELVSPRLSELLLIDNRERTLISCRAATDPAQVPAGSWRELACDGSRIRAVQEARL